MTLLSSARLDRWQIKNDGTARRVRDAGSDQVHFCLVRGGEGAQARRWAAGSRYLDYRHLQEKQWRL